MRHFCLVARCKGHLSNEAVRLRLPLDSIPGVHRAVESAFEEMLDRCVDHELITGYAIVEEGDEGAARGMLPGFHPTREEAVRASALASVLTNEIVCTPQPSEPTGHVGTSDGQRRGHRRRRVPAQQLFFAFWAP